MGLNNSFCLSCRNSNLTLKSYENSLTGGVAEIIFEDYDNDIEETFSLEENELDDLIVFLQRAKEDLERNRNYDNW